MSDDLVSRFSNYQRIALITGVVGLGLLAFGAFLNLEGFFESYLYGFLFWLGLSLGCFFILMLQYVAGGPWGTMVRRPMEAGIMVLPVLALLFVPLLFGMGYLYEWTNPEVVASSTFLIEKTEYLNVPFFIIRSAIYFTIWVGGAFLFTRWARKQEEGADIFQFLRNVSAPGIIIYILTMTFAAIDWGMSLTPEWFSGMYGVIFMIGQALSAMALAIFVTVFFRNREPFSKVYNAKRLQDLGNFLMAFTMFWAYVQMSQFIIIWSNNVVETASWYVYRTETQWIWVSAFLLVFHFFVPFLILFSRWVKQKARALIWVAAWMIFARLVDIFWIVVPTFEREGFPLYWTDAAAVIGIGGIWLAVFFSRLKQRDILPTKDPRVQGALTGMEAAAHD